MWLREMVWAESNLRLVGGVERKRGTGKLLELTSATNAAVGAGGGGRWSLLFAEGPDFVAGSEDDHIVDGGDGGASGAEFGA